MLLVAGLLHVVGVYCDLVIENYNSVNACLLFSIDNNNATHKLTSIFIFYHPLYLYSVVDMTQLLLP